MNIEKDFEKKYKKYRGFIGVCMKHHWHPVHGDGDLQLNIYVDSPELLELMPKIYCGLRCEYFITPGGVFPGCD